MQHTVHSFHMVAPLAGAWIEMPVLWEYMQISPVAPLAGAWIEIKNGIDFSLRPSVSLPLRERGLK